MALAILQPAYFNEFFEPAIDGAASSGRMTLAGELVFCFGGLYLLTRQTWTPLQRWWLSLAASVCLLTHVLAMGYCRFLVGGFNINAKHAYLPPMWLLSAIGILVGLIVLLASRSRSDASTQSPAS
jgi:cytochrome bd-type quinol oxidase subunit 2